MLLQSSALKRKISGAEDPRSECSHLGTSTFAQESISGFLIGMKRYGRPHETASGSIMSSATMWLGSSDRISQRVSGGGGGSLISGSLDTVSCANDGLPSFDLMRTGTGPTPSSRTMRVSSPLREISPIDARTNAHPTVGWPANGSSDPGVKMRTRRVLPLCSGGKTKTVSE